MAASKVGSFTPSSPWSLLSLVPPLSTFPSPPELPSPLISRFLSYSPSVGQPLLSLSPLKELPGLESNNTKTLLSAKCGVRKTLGI